MVSFNFKENSQEIHVGGLDNFLIVTKRMLKFLLYF